MMISRLVRIKLVLISSRWLRNARYSVSRAREINLIPLRTDNSQIDNSYLALSL